MKKIHISSKWCLLALSFLGAVFLPKVFPMNADYKAYSNNILPLLVWAGLYWLYKKALEIHQKKFLWPSAILGLAFSAANYIGYTSFLENASIGNPVGLLAILAVAPVFAACVELTLHWFPLFAEKLSYKKEPVSDNRYACIYWLCIFLAWLPILFALWPGIYAYDSIYQTEYYIKQNFLDIHPLLHSLIYGFLVVDLGGFLGSHETGMFVYCILQHLALSGMFALILANMRSAGLKPMPLNIFLLLFMFLPIFPIAASTGTKDILFSGLFALIVLWTIRAGMDPGLWNDRWFIIKFIVTGIFFILFRTQAKPLILLDCILLLLLYRFKHWKQILLSVAVIYLTITGFNAALFSALDVQELYMPQESLSVPTMQMARVMTQNSDQLTEQEKAEITEWIPGYEDYNIFPAISDGVKITLDKEKYKEDAASFYKLWFNLGMKFPGQYAKAWLRLTIGYWFPGMLYPDGAAYHPYWAIHSTPAEGHPEGYLYLDQKPLPGFGWLHKILLKLSDETKYQSIPVLSMLLSSGIIIWTLILCATIAGLNKKSGLYPAIALMLIYWVSLMFGPVVFFRYLFPVIASMPVLIGYLFLSFKKEKPARIKKA